MNLMFSLDQTRNLLPAESDYLEVATAVIVPHGVSETFSIFYIDIEVIFLHILVLQEYWVMAESRIPLKPVLGSMRILALSISPHEQTQ